MWTKSPTLAECTGVNNSNKDGATGTNTGQDFADTLLDALEEPKTLPTPADAALEMSHEPIDRGQVIASDSPAAVRADAAVQAAYLGEEAEHDHGH